MRRFFAVTLGLSIAAPAAAQLATPNAAGIAFAHVHLNVADVEVHKRLWSEHFDGTVVVKGPLSTVKLDGMLVVLTQRAPTGTSQGSTMDHFGFKVRDYDATVARWREEGLEVQSEFRGVEGFRNAYLLAPDGVRFEIQEDTTLAVRAVANHVHFFTPRFRELRDWYVDLFAAVPRARGSIETTADVPGINLTFMNSQAERAPTLGRAIDHIGFEVDDIDAFCRMLEGRAVTLDLACREIPSIELKIAFFTDPSGVRIEITEGFDKY
jgi:catechol 2,3-dioxygenase-like lactoylglutathione lyase family enzyme